MKKSRQFLIYGLISCAIATTFASCTVLTDAPYFRDINDKTKDSVITSSVYKDPVILPDDILSYSIVTIDPTSAAPVNQAASMAVATTLSGTPTVVPGLLVDRDGNISIPIIGSVKVAGLTTFEAKAAIKKIAEHYYKEPDVQLRFANFSVTVLGEVLRPGTFTIPDEKISVLDALGQAGDLTIYGRRDNILVMREENGQKKVTRLNINSADIFRSPYFYLRQNDVIYVEPNKQKIIAADAARTRTLTVAASVAAVLVVLLTRIKF